jgi:hypothetical protein
MASNKVRPTPPPAGPALVSSKSSSMVRPALGALLFGLSGMACGDDGADESGNDTQVPPMPATEGPMPDPTTNPPPMIPPTSTTDESADTGTSTEGGTEIPPMPDPETTDDGTSSSGGSSDSGSSDSGSSSGPIPPMPPPMPPPDGGG